MAFAGAAASSTAIANTGGSLAILTIHTGRSFISVRSHVKDGLFMENSLAMSTYPFDVAGAAASSTAIANTGGSLAILTAALFGGFLMSRAQMPIFAQWLSSLSFVRCFSAPVHLPTPGRLLVLSLSQDGPSYPSYTSCAFPFWAFAPCHVLSQSLLRGLISAPLLFFPITYRCLPKGWPVHKA